MPVQTAMQPRTVVHMIGQAHLDPVWLWPWTEGRAEALATSRSAADRLDEFPEFQFVRGEALVYEWIEQEDPALFAEIRARVAEGRWHLVNGMVVQPDLNIPQGEAIVRQFLLGQADFARAFGVQPTVGYCVDTFGHPSAMPQILRGCGMDSYVFLRPGPHEKELPSEVFRWEGPDGSQVLAHRIAGAYTTRPGQDAAHIEKALAARPSSLTQAMCFFGVGNHGGGPTRTQIADVLAIAGARRDVEVRFSSPRAYFDAVRDEASQLPVLRDELQPHSVGCYTANSALKRAYRLAECRLLVAERLATLAAVWVGGPVGRERLNALWRDLCVVQFHDVLCGTTTREGADDALMALGRVALGAQEVANDAGRAVGAMVDTIGPGGTVLLFNPGAEPLRSYFEYEPWTDWEAWADGWSLYDETGAPVPQQRIETHEALSRPDHGPRRLVFPIELPALGYRLYRFHKSGDAATPESGALPVHAALDRLDNDRVSFLLDAGSGAITSCIERASGIELVGPAGWNIPLVLEDMSDTWSHDVVGYTHVIGQFSGPRITLVDAGPLQASLLIERSYEGNVWLQQLILRAGEPDLLIRNWLHWRGQWRMLKLGFDVATSAPRAFHDVPFGWLERPCDGREVPTQMWMAVCGRSFTRPESSGGLAVINDGKYGCDVTGSCARLSVLRCPPFAYHQPHPFGSKRRYDWLDQGLQEFNVVLRPFTGDWRDAGIVRRAREINLPPVAITMHGHRGPLPPAGSLLHLDSRELELTAFKPAETGEGAIVRIADRHGRGGSGALRFADHTFHIESEPFRVQTFLLARNDEDVWRCIPSDMLERPLDSA